MEPTWHSRDLPVLDAIVQVFDEAVHCPVLTVGQLSTRMGWPAELVFRACQALEGAFIAMSYVMAGGAVEPQGVAEVYPAARRAVGQWPSAEQYFDRLVEALDGSATALPEGEERTRLQRAVVAMRGMSRDVAVGVATAALGGAVS